MIAPFVVTLPSESTEKFGVALFFPIDNAPALVILKAVLSVASLPTITSEPNLDCVTPPWIILNPLVSKLAVVCELSSLFLNSILSPYSANICPFPSVEVFLNNIPPLFKSTWVS